MSQTHVFLVTQGDLITPDCIPRSFWEKILQSPAIERGDAVFDVMEARGTECFRFSDHVDRFFACLNECKIGIELNHPQLIRHIREALTRACLKESIVRIEVLPGNRKAELDTHIIIKISEKEPVYPAAVKTFMHYRSMPHVKLSGSYVYSEIIKRKYGCDEILYVDPSNNFCLEGARSNFFAVADDRLYGVSWLDYRILTGITRDSVLKIIASDRFRKYNERCGRLKSCGPITLDMITRKKIDEAMLVSTVKGIVSIKQFDINGAIVPMQEGEITFILRELLNEYREDYYRTHMRVS